ncbi:MAG: DUF4271 domain-containing protein [Vicingaceae bacterium]
MSQQNSVTPYFEGVDSTYTLYDFAQDVVVESKMFHATNPYIEGSPKDSLVENWMILFILLCLVGIAFIRSFHRKRYRLLFKIIFNWKMAKQIIRYEKVYTHPVNLILISIFIFTTPLLFGILGSQHFGQSEGLLKYTLWIAIPLFAYVLLKLIFHQFFAWLFNLKEVMEEYIFHSSLFNKIYGVLNLIFLILLLFGGLDSFLLAKLSLISLGILLLLQLSRGFLIGYQYKIFPLLIILYLCTLEILPWLCIGKLISNQLN